MMATTSFLVPVLAAVHTNQPEAEHPALASITIMGSGRVGPTAAALLGLVGAVIGRMALTRARGRPLAGSGATTIERNGANAALLLGVVSLTLGGLFLATADGGPGTGNGVVGSAAAIVLGATAMVLGWLARARHGGPHSIAAAPR
jgi:hypothetical protein